MAGHPPDEGQIVPSSEFPLDLAALDLPPPDKGGAPSGCDALPGVDPPACRLGDTIRRVVVGGDFSLGLS